MATFKTPVLLFEEDTSLENLTQSDPNSLVMMVMDGAGKKQFFRLNTSAIEENQTILCNTQDGMCLKLINGVWMWVPC